MTGIETDTFIEKELLPRWPDFKPSGVELADFKFFLAPADNVTALRAVRQHASESNWKRPVLKKILEHIARLSPKPAAVAARRRRVKIQRDWPRYYLSAIGGRPGDCGCYRKGRIMLVDVPSGLTSEAEYKSVENFMQKTIKVYGGKWQIVVVKNWEEMKKFRTVPDPSSA
ncbi:MAG: hypothetical protein PHP01_05955 [Phycisphaerae bacterium]|nr:hypothetical protein [Phycisphaerae bacterium]